jgi:hypothetical protein
LANSCCREPAAAAAGTGVEAGCEDLAVEAGAGFWAGALTGGWAAFGVEVGGGAAL